MDTGTRPAIEEKVRGIKAMLAGGSLSEEDTVNVKANLAKWEAKLK